MYQLNITHLVLNGKSEIYTVNFTVQINFFFCFVLIHLDSYQVKLCRKRILNRTRLLVRGHHSSSSWNGLNRNKFKWFLNIDKH